MTTVTPRPPARGSRETVKRKELVGRLNPLCLRAFSDAAQGAKARGNPYVELAHFIAALAGAAQSDLALIARAAGVDEARLEGDLARGLDALPRGASAVEEFSDHIFHAIQEGWTLAALEGGRDQVRSGDILTACLKTPVLEGLLLRISPEFGRIDPDRMAADLPAILAASAEAGPAPAAPDAPVTARPAEGALSKYATNLTERARAGKIDPVVGRDPEIRQIIDILMRRRQNNPILTGGAGVGKTAVVEGFALRLAQGEVPPQLAAVDLWALDIGRMQAGASVKGEFERRLKAVIDEVQGAAKPVILFIDEAHSLIGAGGAAGTGDAANLLKPALARGELRTVAATTWSEYKQHIENDAALTRRFQVVKIEEPSEAAAIEMLRGMAGVLEAHHRVEILDEAIGAAVRLSHRYIPARQLPDKAISLLDTACARVAVSQHASPAELQDVQRRLQALEIEAGIIVREAAIGIDTADRQAANVTAHATAKAEREEALARWAAEKALVSEILALRAELRGEGLALDAGAEGADEAAGDPAPAPGEAVAGEAQAKPDPVAGSESPAPEQASPISDPTPDPAARLALLREKMADLALRQGERPLILPSVDRLAVGAVVQDWTGIPLGRMLSSQTERALGLAALLCARVVGQDHAMQAIAARVQTGMAGLGAPEKPVGVFLLCGPSGVGKTETALALADALYGGEQNLISINMSEFQEAHTVSTLKGAPPGYVGYGKGGLLTEAVRRRPYAVVLLDEVEKAHPDVHEIFYQVFDKGMMDDSEGRRIDFSNTLILMTSNVGTEEIMALTDAGRSAAPIERLTTALRPPLLRVFPPALLGRLVTVPYLPLSEAMIDTIAGLKLGAIARRLSAAHGAELVIGDGVMAQIRARCTEVDSGGRMIDAILTGTLLPELSRRVLDARLEGRGIGRVTVTGGPEGFACVLD